jgi:hypothetical protein
MKILITESQLGRIILSEQPESVMDRRLGIQDRNMKALGMNPSNTSDVKKYSEDVYGKTFTGHQVAAMLQIGTAFIPVVGPFISAGIGFLEAKSYWDEGDKQSAVLTAIFSSLPLIGSVVSKIPGVKQLGVKGMSLLADKLSKGGKNLSKYEIEVLNYITKEDGLIKKEVTNLANKLKGIEKEANLYKVNYIKKYGEQEYRSLISKYLYGGDNKNEFISTLKNVKNPNIKIKPVVGAGADHKIFSTIDPNKIIKVEQRPGEVDKWFGMFNKYPDIFPKIFRKAGVKGTDGKILSAVVLEKLETKPFMNLWKNMETSFNKMIKTLPNSSKTIDLEYLVKHINQNPSYKKMWNDFLIYAKQSEPSISNKINEFSKMVDELYKITPNPDIRMYNLGYDKSGILKVLDI